MKTLDCLSGCQVYDQALCAASLNFALSPWAYPAVISGWTDEELFSFPAGLVCQMATRTLHLLAIDEAGATLMSGRGVIATYERARFRSTDPHPWWANSPQAMRTRT